MRAFKKLQKINAWSKQRITPLGWKTDWKGDPIRNAPIRFKPLRMDADFVMIIGTTGSGKSMIFSNIYDHMCRIRPCLIIDWVGSDHKLSNKPNAESEGLAPADEPSKVPNAIYLKYPSSEDRGAIEKLSHEIEVLPDIRDYTSKELKAMGFPAKGAEILEETLQTMKFNEIEDLVKFIEKYPSKTFEWKKRQEEMGDNNPYDPDRILNDNTKKSLVDQLHHVTRKKQFGINTSKTSKIIDMLCVKGKNVFLNFAGNTDLARLELARLIDVLCKRLENSGDDIFIPALFVEEADELIPARVQDSDDRKKSEYVRAVNVTLVQRARKQGISVYYCTPSLANINRIVAQKCYEYIIGRVDSEDLPLVEKIVKGDGKLARYIVSRLKGSRDSNQREFLYVKNNGQMYKFSPFQCMHYWHKEKTSKAFI